MKDPQRYSVEEINCCFQAEMVTDDAGDYVLYEDYEKLKSRLASVEAILKVCFSKQPLKITQFTKNRND